eukprot:73783-Pyramimonas_sp.AAC.1
MFNMLGTGQPKMTPAVSTHHEWPVKHAYYECLLPSVPPPISGSHHQCLLPLVARFIGAWQARLAETLGGKKIRTFG